jgi:hypothetical protein
MMAISTVKRWLTALHNTVAILLLASCLLSAEASACSGQTAAAANGTSSIRTYAAGAKHRGLSLQLPRASLGSAVLRRPLQVSAPALPAVIMQTSCSWPWPSTQPMCRMHTCSHAKIS